MHNKVAHAYLFTGPRGTGKTSAARILAKSLNCETGPTPSPCGVCSSCNDITSGNALDVIEIDAASNRSVEDARLLIDRVHFAPVAGRYKVYIIDEVHMLTPQAFNTLLKTLEEPPPNLVFILATTEAHKVLETIISRCQRFDFRRIPQDSMVKRLKEIAETENIQISTEALNLIARRSAGGLRDALGLLDQISVLSDINQEIEVRDVLSLIGALPEDMLIKLSDGIARKDGSYVLQILNELMGFGSEPIQIVKELTIHFRNLLIAATVKENLKDIIDASEEFFDDLRKISTNFKQAEIAQIIDKLAYTERMVKNTTQPTLWLEVGILSICYRHEIFIVEELQKRVEDLERIVATGAVPSEFSMSYEPKPQPKQPKPVISITQNIKKPETIVKEAVKQTPDQPVSLPAEKPEIVPEKPVEKVSESASVEKESFPKPEIRIPERDEAAEAVESIDSVKPDEAKFMSKTDTENLWQRILNAVSNLPTKGMLSSVAVPMALTPDEVVIAFSQDQFINQMKNPNKIKSLEDALNKVFGKKPRVVFKLVSEQEYKESEKAPVKLEPSPEKKILKEAKPEQLKTESIIEVEGHEVEETPTGDAAESPDVVNDTLTMVHSEQVEIVKDIFQGKILNL